MPPKTCTSSLGNQSPVSHVPGGDINHYTNKDRSCRTKNQHKRLHLFPWHTAGGEGKLSLLLSRGVLKTEVQKLGTFQRRGFEPRNGWKLSIIVGITLLHHAELLMEKANSLLNKTCEDQSDERYTYVNVFCGHQQVLASQVPSFHASGLRFNGGAPD